MIYGMAAIGPVQVEQKALSKGLAELKTEVTQQSSVPDNSKLVDSLSVSHSI